MTKRLAFLFLLAALVLAACSGSAANKPSAQSTATSPPATLVIATLGSGPGPQAPAGCTVISPRPTPGPTQASIFPFVGEGDWVKGSETAAVTIIEYSDFQCPFCATLAPVMEQLLKDFPEDLRFVYRHYPLIGNPESPFHDKAALSTQASEAAGLQGKFWEMHDLLFQRQSEWVTLSVADFQTWLIARAGEMGLDVAQFTADLTSQKLVDLAQSAWKNGQTVGMPGTPFLLVNYNIWPNNVPMDYWNLSAVIKLSLLEKRQFTSCPPMTIDVSKEYIATLKTVKGDIVLRLFADKAPLAVNSFVFLARNNWFDGVTFHRVIAGFVAQAGDPTGTGFGGPGYAFDNEIVEGLTFDREGLLAMANAGPGSNGSQFFITYAPLPDLNGGYTIFGEVIAGMDVAKSLTARDPARNADLPPGDEILDVTIEEK